MSYFKKKDSRNLINEEKLMKKTASIALLPLLFIFAALAIFYPLNTAPARSIRLAGVDEENSLYSEMYELGKCASGLCICTVDVRKDGAGVDITAMDREWRAEYLLWQNIRIVKNPSGDIDVQIGYWMVPRVRGSSIAIESAYDVFAKKCREEALALPAEVKKFFFGQYGID